MSVASSSAKSWAYAAFRKGGGGGGGGVVSYPDPDSHSCGWITSPLRERGSGKVLYSILSSDYVIRRKECK